jgi:hypothetical protein
MEDVKILLTTFVEYDVKDNKNLRSMVSTLHQFEKIGETGDEEGGEEEEGEGSPTDGKNKKAAKKIFILNSFTFPFFFKILTQETVSYLNKTFNKKDLSDEKCSVDFLNSSNDFHALIEIVKKQRKTGFRTILLSALKNSKLFFEFVSKNMNRLKDCFENYSSSISGALSRFYLFF